MSSARRLLACVPAVALVGCGSAAHTVTAAREQHPGVCKPQSRAAIAAALAVPAASITGRKGTGNNGMPQCSFSVRATPASTVDVTANIDTAPQAAFRLERTIVEATQVWSNAKLAAPRNISGLGIGASWFPSEQQLLTSDGVRLITVSIHWPRTPTPKKTALAEAVARTYLGPLHPPP